MFPLKDKNDYKSSVIYKRDCPCGSCSLVKPNVIQKLNGMKIIIQLKFQNHQNTFEATSTTVLHGLSFQMFQKMLRPGETLKSYIALWKPDVDEEKDFERLALFRNCVT